MSKSLVTSTNNKLKNLLDFEYYKLDHEDQYCGTCPWPPRSYNCSFCGREFRSAQALGGHMNIHRRDRARLRDQSLTSSTTCPSWVNVNVDHPQNSNSNPNPNPSPSFPSTANPSSSSSNIYSHQYSLLTLSLSSFSSPTISRAASKHDEENARNHILSNLSRGRELEGFLNGDRPEGFKARKIVQVDLELSLVGGGKEELDLELRLGMF
ncbi:hypothetical protein Droror1_Dr00018137 [Drosera rotundifolia]